MRLPAGLVSNMHEPVMLVTGSELMDSRVDTAVDAKAGAASAAGSATLTPEFSSRSSEE